MVTHGKDGIKSLDTYHGILGTRRGLSIIPFALHSCVVY